MRCLITGASGDIGSILYRLYREAGMDIQPFRDGQNFKGDRILHLAAKSPPAGAEDIIGSNILYLKKIADCAVRNKIEEFIFFSSVSIYGNQNKEGLSEMDCPIEPGLYGASKFFGEALLKDSPLKVLSIRLPAVLGLRNKTNIMARFYMKLRNNERIEITNAERLFNNFISVENIFDFLAGFKFKHRFDAINLASKKEATFLEIVELMKEIMGSRSEVRVINRKDDFYNISTEKAQSEYAFNPYAARDSIERWIRQRDEYEKGVGLQQ